MEFPIKTGSEIASEARIYFCYPDQSLDFTEEPIAKESFWFCSDLKQRLLRIAEEFAKVDAYRHGMEGVHQWKVHPAIEELLLMSKACDSEEKK